MLVLLLLLQGAALISVHSMLRFSGDLTLYGVPDRPGVPGSWPLLPVANLVGDGYLEFQVGAMVLRVDGCAGGAASRARV